MAGITTGGNCLTVSGIFVHQKRYCIPARACYHSFGFVDDEKLTVFDYPCQKMILKICH